MKSKPILYYAWLLRKWRTTTRIDRLKGTLITDDIALEVSLGREEQGSLKNRTWGLHPVSSTQVGPMPKQVGTGVLQQPGPMRRDRE